MTIKFFCIIQGKTRLKTFRLSWNVRHSKFKRGLGEADSVNRRGTFRICYPKKMHFEFAYRFWGITCYNRCDLKKESLRNAQCRVFCSKGMDGWLASCKGTLGF